MITKLLEPFLPTDKLRATKDRRAHLNRFVTWLDDKAYDNWDVLELATYRDHLLNEVGFAPSSVQFHLGSVRTWLRELIQDRTFHEALLNDIGPDFDETRRQEILNSRLGRLLQVVDPSAAPVERIRETPDNLNLSDHDVNELLYTLQFNTPIALRDGAVIALMAATGLREAEVCALNVEDIHRYYEDKPALHVPPGRGCTERFVPYLDMVDVVKIVDQWLKYAKITSGPVFRGFYKSGIALRNTRLSVRSVEQLLANYPISVNGSLVRMKPLNLRHAYAGHLYRMGLDIQTIATYLGVSRLETVWNYIGAKARHEYVPYEFNVSRLERWQKP